MRMIKSRKLLIIPVLCLLFLTLSALRGVSAYAAEMPEAEKEEGRYAETVIRVKAEEGTQVTVEPDEGSPEPDRASFLCTGNKEKDFFTVRITEPGDYGYSLTVGTNRYTVKIAGVYEETEDGEVFTAKTAIMNPDGTKTDEPTWTPPGETPFGIADIAGRPIGIVVGMTALFTALGMVLILMKKEEKAR